MSNRKMQLPEEMAKEINDSFKPKSVFEVLNAINVNDKIEKKNGLSYVSWAYAWGEAKKRYPNANYTIYERETEYGAVNYFTDGKTCWVKTGVTIDGIEHIEELPVMDFKNKSIPLNNVTSFDINKTIQRSLTKALARHGLGLYVYAGEDLPDEETVANETKNKDDKPTQATLNIVGIKMSELKNLGVDLENPSFMNYLDQMNHGKHDIQDMNEKEAQNFIKVLEAIIKNKKNALKEKEVSNNG